MGFLASTGGKFRSDYELLLELHALTLVACSYALLVQAIITYFITLTFLIQIVCVDCEHSELQIVIKRSPLHLST